MNPIHTSTRLDVARARAADRQRRAAEYRLTRDSSPRPSGRPVALTAALTIVASVGLLGLDPTGGEATANALALDDTSASTAVHHGDEQGRPDGWYVPGRTPPINRVPRSVR